jgi:hypothetical protein
MPDETEGTSGSTAVAEPTETPSSAEPIVAAPAETPSEPVTTDGEPIGEPEGPTAEERAAEFERRALAAEKAQATADRALSLERGRAKREQDAKNLAERERLKSLRRDDPIAFAEEMEFAFEPPIDPVAIRRTAAQEYAETLISELRTEGPFADLSKEERDDAMQRAWNAVYNDEQRMTFFAQTGQEPVPTYSDVIRAEVQVAVERRDTEIKSLTERNTALEQELQGFKARGNPGPEDTPPGSGGASNSYRTQVEAAALHVQRKISNTEMAWAKANLPYS